MAEEKPRSRSIADVGVDHRLNGRRHLFFVLQSYLTAGPSVLSDSRVDTPVVPVTTGLSTHVDQRAQ
jgi:hypothetical protein